MSEPKHVAIIDIGKTNAKAMLVEAADLRARRRTVRNAQRLLDQRPRSADAG